MKKYIYIIGFVLLLAGCGRKDVNTEPRNVTINTHTTCVDGVLYFTMRNSNVFSPHFITSTKINKNTLKPENC